MALRRNVLSKHIRELLSDREACNRLDFVPADAYILAPNPMTRQARDAKGAPLVASFVVGATSGFGVEESWLPEVIVEDVRVDFPEGGSAVVQYGWYQSRPTEQSLRFIIEHVEQSGDDTFQSKVESVIQRIGLRYRQNEILLDYTRGADVVESVRFTQEGA